ncbi:MAG: phytanoyl-CoA dioxygenase family protein [Bacteroidia bacterium]|nr:phytanoyl-CoA dioxygenase family protein [Bacteroidia bacterium]
MARLSPAEWLRTLKAAYVLHNLRHARRLLPQRALYRRYGLRKSVFAPVSSRDFAHLPPMPAWIDQPDAAAQLRAQPYYQQADPVRRAQLETFVQDGYLILKGYYSPEEVAAMNAEVERLAAAQQIGFESGRVMFAYRKSELLARALLRPGLLELLSFLTGHPMELFQSLNFLKGSEQAAHSDSVHMTTYPPGRLAAIWIALEPITDGNGPLIYYPGSHRLPYLLGPDFDPDPLPGRIRHDANARYEAKIAEVIAAHGLEARTFHAAPGDALIWHANLIHGGAPIRDAGSTRKSMVAHYFASDVICYHELTQRPAIKPAIRLID